MTETKKATTATFVERLKGWRGDARLYRLSEPTTSDAGAVDHVIVSAVEVLGVPETYIFPAGSDGKCLSYMEMEGSTKGTLSHAEAIANAGWAAA